MKLTTQAFWKNLGEVVGFLAAALLMVQLSSCGPKAFTKGEYDDPTRVELLDEKFKFKFSVKGFGEIDIICNSSPSPGFKL